MAQSDGTSKLTSVVSETFPHLKRGAMRDFLSIMEEQGYYDDTRWNRSDCIYTFETGSKIEFFSADQPGKVRGPRRDRLFMNEANNIRYEIWDQLLVRTADFAFADWNPTNEFWFYTEILNKRDDVDFITLTYKDNEGLGKEIIKDIEAHKYNKNWWLVYGLGQLGDVEGRIFTDWVSIDEIPHEARLERRGLDFGYSNDPSALIDIYYYNGGFILDERLYRKGLTNKQIADFINNMDHPQTTIYADSAEPKSIDEIHTYGVNIQSAQKGQGSVNQGIAYIQDQKISYTKRSLNIQHEYRNYMWETDRLDSNIILNKPMDAFNHAMDAVRYGLETYMRAANGQVGVVNTSAYDKDNKSFFVNEDGYAEAFHIDISDVAKRAMDEAKRQ